MGSILAFILILLLVFLFFLLGIFIFAYTKIMQLWYKLTGKKPNNPFGAFTGSFGGNYSAGGNSSGTNSNTQYNNSSNSTKQSGQRIFAENEGEYVDFEIVDEKKKN